MNTLIVTSCGAKKRTKPMEAYKLYKSARIKAVYNRRGNCDMAILSAKYGLIDVNTIIEPYNKKMDEQSAIELLPQITKYINYYDQVIFYSGGSNKYYKLCIESACKIKGKKFTSIGYNIMGDINKLPSLIINLKDI